MIIRRLSALCGALLIIPLLGWAVYRATVLAQADAYYRQGTVDSIEKAITLTPGNAHYHDQLAYANDLEGGPAAFSLAALRRSTGLNPRNSEAWITMGLARERARDFAGAERCFFQAAAIDRQFDTSWTLANYYFRRGDFERFAPLARSAVRMSFSDPRPIFSLAWMLTNDAGVILREVVPPEPLRITQYLSYLTAEGKLSEGKPVSEVALQSGDPEVAVPTLSWYMARLVEKNYAKEAVQVWNGLCANRWILGEPFDVAQGRSLANGDFSLEPTQMVFGWYLHRPKGVSVTRYQDARGLRITFSGSQPESLEVLFQYLPVIPGRKYRLTSESTTSPLPKESGLRWLLIEAAKGTLLNPDGPHISSETWTKQSVDFAVPADAGLVRLSLQYNRAGGTTPIEGWAMIRGLRLEPAP